MSHPDFFDAVPRISLYDPLAEFLGAAEDGVLYGGFDVVRLPATARRRAAYWSTCAKLYPIRCRCAAIFARNSVRQRSGVTGVIAKS